MILTRLLRQTTHFFRTSRKTRVWWGRIMMIFLSLALLVSPAWKPTTKASADRLTTQQDGPYIPDCTNPGETRRPSSSLTPGPNQSPLQPGTWDCWHAVDFVNCVNCPTYAYDDNTGSTCGPTDSRDCSNPPTTSDEYSYSCIWKDFVDSQGQVTQWPVGCRSCKLSVKTAYFNYTPVPSQNTSQVRFCLEYGTDGYNWTPFPSFSSCQGVGNCQWIVNSPISCDNSTQEVSFGPLPPDVRNLQVRATVSLKITSCGHSDATATFSIADIKVSDTGAWSCGG